MKNLSLKNNITKFGLLAVCVLGITTLSACSEDTASSNTNKTSTNSANKETSFEDWQIKYDNCLNKNGVSSKLSAGGKEASIDMSSIDEDSFRKASDICQKEVGIAPAREGQKTSNVGEVAEELLKINACLRKHGYEVDDAAAAKGMLGLPSGVSDEHMKECNTLQGSEKK